MGNTTGWTELMNGSMVEAVYQMYDSSMLNMGLTIIFLFFVTQMLIYAKTKNVTVMFLLGMFFASLYAISPFVTPFAIKFIFILLAIELGAILLSYLLSKRDLG